MANFTAGDPLPATAFNWTTWTPTLTNLTLGNGTVTARYRQLANTVSFHFKFVFGSSSSVGTDPTFTLPATLHSSYSFPGDVVGDVMLQDASSSEWRGAAVRSSGSAGSVTMYYVTSSATFASITSTAPFTWVTGDSLSVTGTYEAA